MAPVPTSTDPRPRRSVLPGSRVLLLLLTWGDDGHSGPQAQHLFVEGFYRLAWPSLPTVSARNAPLPPCKSSGKPGLCVPLAGIF